MTHCTKHHHPLRLNESPATAPSVLALSPYFFFSFSVSRCLLASMRQFSGVSITSSLCRCVVFVSASVFRCQIVLLVRHLGAISPQGAGVSDSVARCQEEDRSHHVLCFGTLFIVAELRSFSISTTIPPNTNLTRFSRKNIVTHWSSVSA